MWFRSASRVHGWHARPVAVVALMLAAGCLGTPAPGPPVVVRASVAERLPAPGTAPPPAVATPTAAWVPPAPSHAPLTWLAYGDSITFDAFSSLDGWAEAFPPGSAPAVRNAGVPGMSTHAGALRLDEVLADSPDARLVGLAFGTNDVYSGIVLPAAFRARLQDMAERVRAAGRTPMLARIPWSPLPQMTGTPAFNEAIAAIERKLDLTPGPDLYGWFEAHPDQVDANGVHMTPAGNAAIRRLWAEALKRGEQAISSPSGEAPG